jgi:DNA-binding transcriptional regulator of glucitol operon
VTWLRRWGGYLALVIVFAIACGFLSWWQWSRRAEAVAEIGRIEAN